MKNKQIFAKGIRIFIYILYVLATFFVCYKAYNIIFKNNGNENPEKTSSESIDKETISVLVSHIPYYTFTAGVYKDAYNGTKIMETDVEDTLVAKSILGRYSESYTSKKGNTEDVVKLLKEKNLSDKEIVYYKSNINNFLMKYYNVDLSKLKNLSVDIIYLNDKYLTANIKSILMPKRNRVTLNYIVYKDNEDIIILEKAVFYELNRNDNKYYIYADSNIDNNPTPIKTYEYTNELGETININDVIQNDLTDYETQFKHTFKKNGTGYYWYSTELTS